jgi:hypothetical protein
VILGQSDIALLLRAVASGINSNFGPLTGGWLELNMPELGLGKQIRGFGSDLVMQAVQRDSSDFSGLVGLPFLRMVAYGGNDHLFWLDKIVSTP